MCDLETPEFCEESRPKAAKEHRCCECRGTIYTGEIYHLLKGVWNGEFQTYKTCTDCRDLIDGVTESPDHPVGVMDLAIGEFFHYVFESKNKDIISVFMSIRRTRGAKQSPGGWMEEKEEKLNQQ